MAAHSVPSLDQRQPAESPDQGSGPLADPYAAAEALIRGGSFQAAFEAAQRLVASSPGSASAWGLLGLALRGLGHPGTAVGAYRRALQLEPGRSAVLTNLGNALKDCQRLDEAVAVHSAAVNADPASPINWLNLGVALRERGELHGALAAFERVQALAPNDVNGHWDRAQVLLMLGRFAEGWDEFEWRWRLPGANDPPYPQPRWDGRALRGALLLWPEQGFGDSLLATRYLPAVRRRVGRLILGSRPELARYFRALPGVDEVVPIGGRLPEFAAHLPLLSLPRLFGTTTSNVPAPVSAPPPDEAVRKLEAATRCAGERLKIGIVWSGSISFKNNHLRSVGIENFLQLAEVRSIQLFSLQKGPRESDLDAARARGLIIDLAPALDDFADTAAAVDAMDLIIMTDSSVAHLAASRGRPVWNLLSYVPYWLYLRDRTDTPWYPSMRLFRQPAPGEWGAVFAEVRRALEAWVTNK